MGARRASKRLRTGTRFVCADEARSPAMHALTTRMSSAGGQTIYYCERAIVAARR